MSANSRNNIAKKSIVEQMTAFLSLIFAVILITVIAIPQVLQAFFRLIYYNRRNRKDIRGKLAIVAGAGDGNELMKLISLKLAQFGCNLVIIGDDLDENFIKQISNEKVTVKSLKVNETDVHEVNKIYQNISDEFGNIDMLINVPKLIRPHELDTQSVAKITDDLNKVFSTSMILTLSMIDVMKNQKEEGHIITISPTTGLSTIPEKYPQFSVLYSFMKSIKGFIKSDKLDGKIKTTIVQPSCLKNGTMLTEFIDKNLFFLPMSSDEIIDDLIEAIFNSEDLVEIPSNAKNLTRLIKYFKLQ